MNEITVTTEAGRIMALVTIPEAITMDRFAETVHAVRQEARQAIRESLMADNLIDAHTYMPIELVATHYNEKSLPHRFRFARL